MTKTTVETPPEEAAAAALVALSDKFEALGLDTLPDRLKALEEIGQSVKGLNAGVVAEHESRLQKIQDDFKHHLRNKQDHAYVPGLEDMEDKFSVTRALCGFVENRATGGRGEKSCKHSFEKVGAGLEHEVISQTSAKMAERFPDVYGQAASTFDDDNAGSFIPDQVIASEIITPIYRESLVVNLGGKGPARVRVLDGLVGGARLPRFGSGTVAYWLGEEDAIQESYARTKMEEMTPKKLGVLTRVTNEMREGQGFGWNGMLEQDMREAMQAEVDYAFFYGKDGNAPRGLFSTQGVRVFSAQDPQAPGDGSGRNLQELYVGDKTEEGEVAPVTIANAQGGNPWEGGLCDFDGLEAMGVILEEDDVREENMLTFGSPTYFRKLKALRVRAYVGQPDDESAYLTGVPTLTNRALRELIGDFDKSSLFTKERVITLDGNGKKVVAFVRNKTAGQSVGATPLNALRNFNDVIRGQLSTSILGRWNGLELADDGGMGVGFASGVIQVKLVMRMNFHHKQPRKYILCPDAQVNLS